MVIILLRILITLNYVNNQYIFKEKLIFFSVFTTHTWKCIMWIVLDEYIHLQTEQ